MFIITSFMYNIFKNEFEAKQNFLLQNIIHEYYVILRGFCLCTSH